MADPDLLARLRKLEAEHYSLKHRIAELERQSHRHSAPALHDVTQYRRLKDSGRLPIWPTAEEQTAAAHKTID